MNNVSMEKERINVAEILRNCQAGMNLDCVFFENVEFDRVDDKNRIRCFVGSQRDEVSFNEYGCLNGSPSAKCVIFPKGQTWEEFVSPCQFKNGDIVSTESGMWIGITTGGKRGVFIPTYCVINPNDELYIYFNKKEKWLFDRLATEEKKQKLFDIIKANGYRWNEETKTLEKLVTPKFKVGDKIRKSGSESVHEITDSNEGKYLLDDKDISVLWDNQDEWDLVCPKFNISALKPFERVLVRDSDHSLWCASMFSHVWKDKYYCTGVWYYQCIPYELNEHLLGTTNDCDDFYKNWKNENSTPSTQSEVL